MIKHCILKVYYRFQIIDLVFFFNFWIYVLTFYKVIRCLFELAGWLSVKHTCHQARWSTFTAWNPDDHRDSTPASCPLASTLVLWCSSGPTRVNTLNK